MNNFLVAGSYNKLFYGYEIISSKEELKEKKNEEKNENEEKEENIKIEEKEENKYTLHQKFLSAPHNSSFTCITSCDNLCASGSTDESIK
jgi:uncharacterized membrane-anchored protein